MDIHGSRKAVQELNALYTDLREGKKKDDTYLEPDMKKRQANNEKARKELAKGPQMKNPHFEENGWDSVKSFANAYKAVHEGIRDEDPEKGTKERKARPEKKRGMKLDDHPQYKKEEVENVDEMIDPKGAARMDAAKKKKKVDVFAYDRKLQAQGKLKGKKLPPAPTNEALDPVGKEDKDIDNDGDVDKSDKYLHKRRKAIGKAIAKKKGMSEQEEKIGGKTLKGMASKATKRVDADNDGDVDKDDPKETGMGEFVPTPGKKFKTKIGESFSDWRNDLREIVDTEEQDQQIKEKKVKNKVVIDPELKLESVADDLGATLIEMVELDELDFIVEGVYDELLEEGYDEDLIEDAIEYALTEAKVTMGHDTDAPKRERTRDRLKKSAKGFIGKMAYKGYHAARKAKRAAEPAVQRAKTSAKRGIRKAALKVADRLKEENVDEAVYGGTPEKKKDTRMTVTAADKKANTPAYQKFKAGDKRYKAADHMGEGLSIDQQMKISRDHNRKSPEEKKAANMKALGTIKKVAAKKDTRTDAQKMTDATGPRPGSRYRGD